MTYTFYNNSEGIYILYDSVSGAAIRSGELEAYICDALDPCGENLASSYLISEGHFSGR